MSNLLLLSFIYGSGSNVNAYLLLILRLAVLDKLPACISPILLQSNAIER